MILLSPSKPTIPPFSFPPFCYDHIQRFHGAVETESWNKECGVGGRGKMRRMLAFVKRNWMMIHTQKREHTSGIKEDNEKWFQSVRH